MKSLAMTSVALAILAWAVQARADQVTLQLEGVHTDEDGDAIIQGLRNVDSVKVATKPTKEKPTAVVAFDPKKTDVGELAQVIAATKTPNRDKGAPATILVFGYERLDASAVGDEQYLPKIVEPAFAKLKGVDAKKCKLDTKQKQLQCRLDDKGGAKLADIKAAFPGLTLK